MSKQIHCQACSTQFAVSPELFAKHFAGKKAVVKCRRCGAHITVDSRNGDTTGAPKVAAPQGAISQGAISQGAISQGAISQGAISQGATGRQAASRAASHAEVKAVKAISSDTGASEPQSVQPPSVNTLANDEEASEGEANYANADQMTAVTVPPPSSAGTLGISPAVPSAGPSAIPRANSPSRKELRAALTSRGPTSRPSPARPVLSPPTRAPSGLRGTLTGLQSPGRSPGPDSPTVPEQPSAKRPQALDATMVGVAPPSPGGVSPEAASAGGTLSTGVESPGLSLQRARPKSPPGPGNAAFKGTMLGLAPPPNALSDDSVDDLSVIAELPLNDEDAEAGGETASSLASEPAHEELDAAELDSVLPPEQPTLETGTTPRAISEAPMSIAGLEDEDTAVYTADRRAQQSSEPDGSERLAVSLETSARETTGPQRGQRKRTRGGLIAAAALLLSVGGAGLFWWQSNGQGLRALAGLTSSSASSAARASVEAKPATAASTSPKAAEAAPVPEIAPTLPLPAEGEATPPEGAPVAAEDVPAEKTPEVADSPSKPNAAEKEDVGRDAVDNDVPALESPPQTAALNNAPGYDSVPASVDPQRVTYLVGLAMKRARQCHLGGRATGTATAFLTFGQDGQVSDAHLVGEPIASAPVARCILGQLKAVRLKAFEDAPFIVSEEITLR